MMALLHGLIDLLIAGVVELKRWEINQARHALVEIYVDRWADSYA
jgi:hypothetical protein